MNSNQSLTARDQEHYLQVYKRFPVAFSHGTGAVLTDVEGRDYIDALAGIAVNNLGYANPAITKTICDQAGKLLHISNFFITEAQVRLSEKLTKIAGLQRVFMTNSGAESVEGAIKVARKYGHKHEKSGDIISMTGSFHGRTLATIATGKGSIQKGFDPIPGGFHQVKFNDLDAIQQAIEIYQPAAVIIEPIQGEGGIHPVDQKYIQELRKLCDETKTLLILDEIQCGMGRTGSMFYFEQLDVKPDILTLAKGLGGGFPVGAFLTTESVAEVMEFGDHGTTFGGNPLACAVALACIEILEDASFLEEVKVKGEQFTKQLKAFNHPMIKEIRGAGMMIGVELNTPSKPVVLDMLKQGVIANSTAEHVVRFLPPLIIEPRQLNKVAEVFLQALENLS